MNKYNKRERTLIYFSTHYFCLFKRDRILVYSSTNYLCPFKRREKNYLYAFPYSSSTTSSNSFQPPSSFIHFMLWKLSALQILGSLGSFLPFFSKVYRIFIFLGSFEIWGKILPKLPNFSLSLPLFSLACIIYLCIIYFLLWRRGRRRRI